MAKIKTVVIIGMFMLVLTAGLVINILSNDPKNLEQQIYQGPVPEGYDTNHFRLTGETVRGITING